MMGVVDSDLLGFLVEPHLEGAVRVGKNLLQQLPAIVGREILPPIFVLPPEVVHYAVPIAIGVSLLDELGEAVSEIFPLKFMISFLYVR